MASSTARAATASLEKIPVPCPVCDGRDATIKYRPWLEVDDPKALYGAASGIRGTQTLVTCRECGMIYESPRYPDDVILGGYAASDDSGHDSQYEMRVDSFHAALERLSPKLPPVGSRVLDVGTAGGAFLAAAERYGYRAEGVEPSRSLVDSGRRRGLSIKHGTVEAGLLAPGSFDMICLWDVLEHVPSPKTTLGAIRPLLKRGGTLLINYPDIGTPMARLAGKRFWWILSVHLHHFAPETVRDVCRRTGFEVYHLQPYWQTLELGYLEGIAAHLGVPGAGVLQRLTPAAVRALRLPYYASQTTALAHLVDG